MVSHVHCCKWSRALPAHRRSAAAAAAVPPWLLQKWWSLGWLLERARVPHVRVASVIWTYPIRCGTEFFWVNRGCQVVPKKDTKINLVVSPIISLLDFK